MRDSAAMKAEIEAAIEEACQEFRWLKGLGWFPKKSPVEPDGALNIDAHLLIKKLPDKVMPEHLRDYVCGVLSRTRKELRHTYAAGRDLYIVDVIYRVTMRGFPPTRNDATRDKEERGEPAGQSACSIVTKALARVGVSMNERHLEDIWSAQSEKVVP
jgi:hypothetical protein